MATSEKPKLSGRESTFDDDELIVSKTDLTGKLTYANRTFFRLAEMEPAECIGKQHNIIRNPEMPRVVFDLLWKTIQTGNEIFAYVNNRAKSGNNYWVFAHVTPSKDSTGAITGYHSNRRTPNRTTLDQYIKPLYQKLSTIESSASSPKDGLIQAHAEIDKLLTSKNLSFNELMFSLRGQ